MKKIITGAIMLAANPFIILLGSKIIYSVGYNIPEGAVFFACILGGASIIFNFIMGIALIVRGHQENQTFKGW